MTPDELLSRMTTYCHSTYCKDCHFKKDVGCVKVYVDGFVDSIRNLDYKSDVTKWLDTMLDYDMVNTYMTTVVNYFSDSVCNTSNAKGEFVCSGCGFTMELPYDIEDCDVDTMDGDNFITVYKKLNYCPMCGKRIC